METKIYPLTIISDRYSGVYSKGRFTAWNLDFFDIPRQIEGDDIECSEFWTAYATGQFVLRNGFNKKVCVGIGKTPNDAVIDLEKELKLI